MKHENILEYKSPNMWSDIVDMFHVLQFQVATDVREKTGAQGPIIDFISLFKFVGKILNVNL